MAENNTHTSVVLEVGNQTESEDQKIYKIDFDDVDNSPKDYVIDQIFCGENVTVYALFEISDVSNRKSDQQLVEVTSSAINKNYRFYHKESFNKEVSENILDGYAHELTVVDSRDENEFIPNHRKESLYHLKHFKGSYEISGLLENTSDMKVLYSRDLISKNQEPVTYKGVSKGVNTDIAQCPKLLQEIQEVMNLDFAFSKNEGKTIEKSSCNPPYEIIEIETPLYSSSSDLEKRSQKSSPNFVLVPLVMLNEEFLSQYQREGKIQAKTKEKTSKKPDNITTLDASTYHAYFDLSNEKNGEIKEENQSEMSQLINIEKYGTNTLEEAKGGQNVEFNQRNKKMILNEIKNLQLNLNSLIKRLEFNDFDFEINNTSISKEATSDANTCSENTTAVISTSTQKPEFTNQIKNDSDLVETEQEPMPEPVSESVSEPMPEPAPEPAPEPVLESAPETVPESVPESVSESVPESVPESVSESVPESVPEPVSEPVRRNQKKFDELPIFSAPSELLSSNKLGSQKKQKKALISDSTTKEKVLSPSAQSTASLDNCEYTLSPKQTVSKEYDLKLNESTNWEEFDKRERATSKSKSETSFRFIAPCHHELRKSLSLELREEKSDAFGNKKVKYSSLRLEGNAKSKGNARTHSNFENVLVSSLALLDCEMGDEITQKPKNLKPDRVSLNRVIENKDKLLNLYERDILESNVKKQNEDEGDMKTSIQKGSTPKFAQNNQRMTVQYCNTTTRGTPGAQKNEKNPSKPKGKPKTPNKNTESKNSFDVDKVKTPPGLSQKKLNTTDKENKEVAKSGISKIEKPTKIDKKETVYNTKKLKLVSGSRKSALQKNDYASNPESKLHIDKLIKRLSEDTSEAKLGKLANQKQLPPSNPEQRQEEKCEEKSIKTFAIPSSSQKQELQDPTSTSPTKGSKKKILSLPDKNLPVSIEKQGNETNLKHGSSHLLIVSENMMAPKISTDSSFLGNSTLLPSCNPSSVILELFSKKPKSVDEFNFDYDRENFISSKKSLNLAETESEKPIVKSVWALTKVLLYEDGTKKFEVLEASLTPPEYCLKTSES